MTPMPQWLLLLALFCASGELIAQSGDRLLVAGGWRFETESGRFVPNRGILITSGRFSRIDGSPRSDQSTVEVVSLGDEDYILPGLIDLHAHYNVNLFGRRRRDEVDVNPVLWLANGVTSTFPAGEYDPGFMQAAQQAIDTGKRPGARILRSGPYFGTARAGWAQDATDEWIEEEVGRLAAQGVAGFKAKGIGPAHLQALIRAAHRRGLTVTAHLGSGFRDSVNPASAIRMGIDRVEHFLGGEALLDSRSAYASLEKLDPGQPSVDRIIQLYLDFGVNFDATLSAYGYFGKQTASPYRFWTDESRFLTPFVRERLTGRPQRRVNAQFDRIFDVKKKTLKRFYESGGGDLITLGTDHPSWGQYLAGFLAHRELEAMVTAGLPPAAVLRIATINGARAIGMGDRLGSIASGKLADLFVVEGNPLEDIRRTRKIRLVIKSGVLYDARQLLGSVEGKLGPRNATEAEEW